MDIGSEQDFIESGEVSAIMNHKMYKSLYFAIHRNRNHRHLCHDKVRCWDVRQHTIENRRLDAPFLFHESHQHYKRMLGNRIEQVLVPLNVSPFS